MGEWAGYFAGDALPEPIFEVKSIMHRNNPILFGAPINIGAYDLYNGACIIGAALVYACKPCPWKDEFPRSLRSCSELLQRVRENYKL